MRWLTKRKAIVAIVAMGLLALLGLEAFRYAHAYHNLRDGKNLLVSAADLLEERGLDITEQELDEADARLVRARDKLDSASGVLGFDPLLSVASHLPWMGTQVDAARNLADVGIDSSDIGIEAVEAVREFQQIRDTQGGALSEKVVPVLEAIGPNVAIIEDRLATVHDSREDIPEDGLLSPLSSAVRQLDDHIEELETRLTDYRRAERMAPKVLGYDGPQTYLVLAHDNTEILGTGGFILVYGFLTFDQGRLERLFFDDVGSINPDWPPATNGYIDPPRPLQTYLLGDWPMGLAEASWWPDFPTAAQNAIEIYRTNSSTDEPIDGVIGVNFLTLEQLLDVLGPVTVEEYEATVTSEDVTEKTLIITHPEGTRPWETHRYDFVGYLAKEVIDRTLSAGPSKWASMLSALRTVGREKNLLLYHGDPAIQQVIADFGWDGGLKRTDGDYLMVVDSSLRSSKLNLVVEPRIDLDVSIDWEGNATNVATISYTNDHSSWAEGKDPQLVRLVTAAGSLNVYGNYLRLLVPTGSSLRALTEEGKPVGAEEIWMESDRTVFARYFALPLDAAEEVSFTYAVPSVTDRSEAPHEYRLLIQKQPGTRAIPLTVTIHPPPGLKIVSIELDGEDLQDKPTQVVTDLLEDREVVLRYSPRR